MDRIKCEAFLAAAESGSLSQAARKLGYTQPGITRMIDALEEEVGFPLLLRTKRGVSLTANGEEMLPRVREILRAYRLAEETAASIRQGLSGTLTIGCYWSVAAMLLPNILRAFLRDYPNVHIELREGTNDELSRLLRERAIDFSFSAQPAEKTPCDWLPVLDDELLVWLPKNHPEAQNSEFPVSHLAKYPFIITQPEHDTDIDRLLENFDVRPDIHFATKDGYTTYRMVEAGLGISLNQRLIAKDWHGRVRKIPFTPRQYIHLGVAVPSLRDVSPAAKKFITYIKQGCAQPSGGFRGPQDVPQYPDDAKSR